jgi:hypothetical protein
MKSSRGYGNRIECNLNQLEIHPVKLGYHLRGTYGGRLCERSFICEIDEIYAFISCGDLLSLFPCDCILVVPRDMAKQDQINLGS